jgi:hypothetical protein
MSDYKVTLTRPNAPGHLREVIIRDAYNESEAKEIAENTYGGEARIAVLHCGGSSSSSDSSDGDYEGLGYVLIAALLIYLAFISWKVLIAIGVVSFILWLMF